MRNYVIGVGGTGARCLEAVVHLGACGVGPEELFFLNVDPDQANGNVSRAKEVLQAYMASRKILGRGGTDRVFTASAGAATDEDGDVRLNWSPLGGEQTLDGLFRFPALPNEQRTLCRMLYTETERQTDLDKGFRGHPSVGAPFMIGIADSLSEVPWRDLVEHIKEDLGAGGCANVFIFASIFGATGASGFPAIARVLREEAKRARWQNPHRLNIGGCLLLPYFTYMPTPARDEEDEELHAHADLFLLNAKAALSHYDFVWGEGSEFDAVYFLGEDTPEREGRDFALGGQYQENPAHYIELIASLAALDFFDRSTRRDRRPTDRNTGQDETTYSSAAREEENCLRWSDLPSDLPGEPIRKRVLAFAAMSVAYFSFIYPLIAKDSQLFEKHRSLVPWYVDGFRRRALTSSAEIENQSQLRTYMSHFLRWTHEIHSLSSSRTMRLLNTDVLARGHTNGARIQAWDGESFSEILNAEEPESGVVARLSLEMLWREMCSPEGRAEGESATGKLVNLLHRSAERLVDKHYA